MILSPKQSNYVTYAEVSLDVNPSIVYSLNKRNRVLDIRAVNDDAERIVAELEQESVHFTPLSDAVEKTMTILHNQDYLDEFPIKPTENHSEGKKPSRFLSESAVII